MKKMLQPTISELLEHKQQLCLCVIDELGALYDQPFQTQIALQHGAQQLLLDPHSDVVHRDEVLTKSFILLI